MDRVEWRGRDRWVKTEGEDRNGGDSVESAGLWACDRKRRGGDEDCSILAALTAADTYL